MSRGRITEEYVRDDAWIWMKQDAGANTFAYES